MKLPTRIIVHCLLFILLTACEVATNTTTPSNPLMVRSSPLSIHTLSITSSPSPISEQTSNSNSTQDLIPTHTPTLIPLWQDFPGPTEDSEIDIPLPVTPIEFPENAVNIILLGTDRRESWKWYQTDAIMIVSLDPDSGTATILSVPRDLYLYIPGWKVNRINTAEYHGGFEMIANAVLYNLGIPVHHWVRVEYGGFREAIDILEGIDVLTSRRLTSMCEGVPYDYKAGVEYHMDGFDAMCYVRMRMNSSDFDRLRRQEEVARAIFNKVVSIDGILKTPQLYATFSQFVESDLTLEKLIPLMPLVTKFALDSSQIRFYNINSTMVQNLRTPESGQAVLLPKHDLIQEMLEQAFSRP
ncbi:MAG: LCP family protein [Anaerolineales bacterium]|nr:LCP family protein [Anaerolineales bacterium]